MLQPWRAALGGVYTREGGGVVSLCFYSRIREGGGSDRKHLQCSETAYSVLLGLAME